MASFDPADEKCRDMVRWYGGPFDPIGFEEAMARFGMENMAQRRRGPLASPQERIAAGETMNAARWVQPASTRALRLKFGPKSPGSAQGTQVKDGPDFEKN